MLGVHLIPTHPHATHLLNGCEFVGTEAPALVDVAHSLHQGTDNDLGVVLEEVDLRTQT